MAADAISPIVSRRDAGILPRGNTINIRAIMSQIGTTASWITVVVAIVFGAFPEAALLFAMLVGVPVAIRVEQNGRAPIDWVARIRADSTMPCAVIASFGVLTSSSTLSPIAVSFWAIPTMLLMAERACRAGTFQLSMVDIFKLTSTIYLMVAVTWMVCWKSGYSPFGFPLGITMLTAVHFHFAGFLLPELAIRLHQEKPGTLTKLLTLGILCGMPLVAAGMVWSRTIEFGGVLLVIVCTVSIAILQFTGSLSAARPAEKMMFGLAAFCATAASGLAIVYGWSEYQGIVRLQIPQMVRWHGMLNAFGFAGVSLGARSLQLTHAAASRNQTTTCK